MTASRGKKVASKKKAPAVRRQSDELSKPDAELASELVRDLSEMIEAAQKQVAGRSATTFARTYSKAAARSTAGRLSPRRRDNWCQVPSAAPLSPPQNPPELAKLTKGPEGGDRLSGEGGGGRKTA